MDWCSPCQTPILFGNSGFRFSCVVNFTVKNWVEILQDEGLLLLEIPLNSFVWWKSASTFFSFHTSKISSKVIIPRDLLVLWMDGSFVLIPAAVLSSGYFSWW